MNYLLSPVCFIEAAQPILNLKFTRLDGISSHHQWMACFGAKPNVMAHLWTLIDPERTMPTGVKTEHIIWAFYFLKLYTQEEVNTRNVGGPDEKTFRKWVWLFVEAISYQEYPVVSDYNP